MIVGDLFKVIDANGASHDADGKFGSGGSKASDASKPSKRPDLEEHRKKHPRHPKLAPPKPVQYSGTLMHATEDDDFKPSDSKGGGFLGPGLYCNDAKSGANTNTYGNNVHTFKADDIKLMELEGDAAYQQEVSDYYADGVNAAQAFREASIADGYAGIRVNRGIPGVVDVFIYVIWEPTKSLTHEKKKVLTVGDLFKGAKDAAGHEHGEDGKFVGHGAMERLTPTERSKLSTHDTKKLGDIDESLKEIPAWNHDGKIGLGEKVTTNLPRANGSGSMRGRVVGFIPPKGHGDEHRVTVVLGGKYGGIEHCRVSSVLSDTDDEKQSRQKLKKSAPKPGDAVAVSPSADRIGMSAGVADAGRLLSYGQTEHGYPTAHYHSARSHMSESTPAATLTKLEEGAGVDESSHPHLRIVPLAIGDTEHKGRSLIYHHGLPKGTLDPGKVAGKKIYTVSSGEMGGDRHFLDRPSAVAAIHDHFEPPPVDGDPAHDDIEKVVDANGASHDADGKFGSGGGAKASEEQHLTRKEAESLRSRAEMAWGDDTRHPALKGNPNKVLGQCFITANYIKEKHGGSVATKGGHYFWLSPDRKQVVDITLDQFGKDPSVILSDLDDERYRDATDVDPKKLIDKAPERSKTFSARMRASEKEHHAEKAVTLGDLLKMKDASGHEHAANGQFGSGDGATPAHDKSKQHAVFTIGATGSGKGGLAADYAKKLGIDNVINGDDIKESIPGYSHKAGEGGFGPSGARSDAELSKYPPQTRKALESFVKSHGFDSIKDFGAKLGKGGYGGGITHELSRHIALKRLADALKAGASFVYDAVGGSNNHPKYAAQARAKGMHVHTAVAVCPQEVSLMRNHDRERTVPEHLALGTHAVAAGAAEAMKRDAAANPANTSYREHETSTPDDLKTARARGFTTRGLAKAA